MSIHTSKSMSGLGGGGSPIGMPGIAGTHQSTASLSSMVSNGRGGSSDASSIYTFPTPRKSNAQKRIPRENVRRRPPTKAQVPPTRKAKNVQREYQLLQSQILLLAGTAILGFVLFLLFTLPLAALIGLTVLVTSLGACLLVAFSAAKTRYQLEMEHPLGLVRYLPETLRAHLTEKSLHDCLSPSGSVESLASLSRLNQNSSGESLSSMPSISTMQGPGDGVNDAPRTHQQKHTRQQT